MLLYIKTDLGEGMKGIIGIVIKRTEDGWKILTQLRKVKDKRYDPLYDNTWEAMGETSEGDEDWKQTLIRGLREELGVPENFEPKRIIGYDEKNWESPRGGKALCHTPLCVVEQVGSNKPQAWKNIVFPVEVDEKFQPNLEKADGEASKYRWWTPQELLKQISEKPETINGHHLPVLYKVCLAIINQEI